MPLLTLTLPPRVILQVAISFLESSKLTCPTALFFRDMRNDFTVMGWEMTAAYPVRHGTWPSGEQVFPKRMALIEGDQAVGTGQGRDW